MAAEPAGPVPRTFAFGTFVLIPERQSLLSDGVPVRLGGRALDILTVLVNRPGELVTKRELMARVWPDTVVEESNLKVHMAALRRVLGDAPMPARYIATVTRRGYQFIAPVRRGESPGGLPLMAAGAAHGASTRAMDAVAITVSEQPFGSVKDGVWVIDLASLQDADSFLTAITAALRSGARMPPEGEHTERARLPPP
ncbi:Transcriptional regulatory protein, C terminal [Roseateles sp. YR242]|uniref:winged helix-turn-helix domain-containing protein n=1 Tax=Roseateles sp. YR242 TaxID=1855305 RepID=UPI0008C235A1|nr:transcriptional regulator [Roseateles sp. YR242]SEK35183.1 Transcriptional regulatory protein, C terminal [Roseateles sp. YR242]